METTAKLSLHSRRWLLRQDQQGRNEWQEILEIHEIDPAKAALIICDMWDNHWSRGAVGRVEAMIPRMNQVLQAARSQGMFIIHAPSETMAFYQDAPARQRILAAPVVTPPPPIDHLEPPLPVDASDGGSDTEEFESRRIWQRQHPELEIDQDRDVISDNGQEVYNFMCQRGIEHLFIMGVHANMCILNRSFAIKQLVRWGLDTYLVRDLTDAMYNPAKPPYVSHLEGTQLVIGYIERFWCPSVSSEVFLTGSRL